MCSTGSPVWSDDLEGWGGAGEGGEACTMMANLHCCIAEDNTTLLKKIFIYLHLKKRENNKFCLG